MFRFIFRFAALVALSVAVIMAVLDAARTVAASALVLTPFSTSWSTTFPQSYAATQAWVEGAAGLWAWTFVCMPLLDLPGAVLFLASAAVLFMIGHGAKPHRRSR